VNVLYLLKAIPLAAQGFDLNYLFLRLILYFNCELSGNLLLIVSRSFATIFYFSPLSLSFRNSHRPMLSCSFTRFDSRALELHTQFIIQPRHPYGRFTASLGARHSDRETML